MSDMDNPTLEATVNPDAEDPTLEIVVKNNGTVYERIESDVEMLLQSQQFVSSFERPILSLLMLYDRETDDESEQAEEYAADGLDDVEADA